MFHASLYPVRMWLLRFIRELVRPASDLVLDWEQPPERLAQAIIDALDLYASRQKEVGDR